MARLLTTRSSSKLHFNRWFSLLGKRLWCLFGNGCFTRGSLCSTNPKQSSCIQAGNLGVIQVRSWCIEQVTRRLTSTSLRLPFAVEVARENGASPPQSNTLPPLNPRSFYRKTFARPFPAPPLTDFCGFNPQFRAKVVLQISYITLLFNGLPIYLRPA